MTSGTISTFMTAQDIMTAAAQELGVLGAGEYPDADEAAAMLPRLNWMLKSWQANGANLWRQTEGSVTFPINTATVTLDPFVIDVIEARLVQTSTFERPLQRWERGEYMQIPNKATPGWPTAFYLDKQRDAVTLTLWPVPNEALTVLFTYARVIEDVTDEAQLVDVPQQWMETVYTCLAARCANLYGATRLDPNTVAMVQARAAELEQKMLDSDRPASVFLGNIYDRYF